MITASTIPIDDFTEAPFDSQIRAEAPATEVFVATGPFTLTRVGNESSLQFEEKAIEESPSRSAEAILEEVVSSGREDLNRHPKSARPHVNLGLSLMNRGKLREAEAEFRIALEKEPKFFVAGLALARVRAMAGDLEEATRLYESLSEEYPDESLPKTGLAYVAMLRGKFEEAAKLLRPVVYGDGKNVWAQYHLALVLLKLDKLQEAVSLLRDAARTEVRSPAIYHALGVAYAQKGDLKRAIRAYSTALNLAPKMRETVHAFSAVLLRVGEGDKAISVLRDYLEREGAEDTETREILARAYLDLGHHREARGELMKIWETIRQKTGVPEKESARILSNIGLCFALERNTEAEKYFKRALILCSEREPIFYTNLARWYLAHGQAKESSVLLARAKDLFPKNQEIRLLLGLSLENVGNYDGAVRELVHLIETGEAAPEAYADLGWILSDRKRDLDSAREILRTGYEKNPHHIGVVNNYAYVLLMRGEPGGAREVLESAPRNSSGPGAIFLTATWGLLRLWEGNFEEGRLSYQLAEKMAAQTGNRNLARTVRQKMYLELAGAFVRKGDIESAKADVARGLQVRGGADPYREDLEMLALQLPSGSEQLPN